jgi:transposase
MALGKRTQEQQELWIATTELPRSPGHPFYRKLNQLLAENGFDRWLEKLCAPHYAEDGRPSIPPGVYFRMLLVGYFEGIQSQRGIAWRCSDSRSLAEFLGVPPTEPTPEHSSLTRIRKRLPPEVSDAVFERVLAIAAAKKLLDGKTVAVDSTTLEANAAMKSIVRKDTGEDYKAYLRRLAAEDGLEDLSDEELRRYDKNRPNKRVSNGGQRLSCGGHAGPGGGAGFADVHSGARPARAAALAGQAGGTTGGRVCQPAAPAWRPQ